MSQKKEFEVEDVRDADENMKKEKSLSKPPTHYELSTMMITVFSAMILLAITSLILYIFEYFSYPYIDLIVIFGQLFLPHQIPETASILLCGSLERMLVGWKIALIVAIAVPIIMTVTSPITEEVINSVFEMAKSYV